MIRIPHLFVAARFGKVAPGNDSMAVMQRSMKTDWYALADGEARDVIAALPPDLRDCLRELSITLDPYPRADEEQVDGDDEALLGLFDGPCFAEASDTQDPIPAAIHLFVENLRDEAEDDPILFRREVRMTLLHEIGHYLGLEEDELERRGLA